MYFDKSQTIMQNNIMNWTNCNRDTASRIIQDTKTLYADSEQIIIRGKLQLLTYNEWISNHGNIRVIINKRIKHALSCTTETADKIIKIIDANCMLKNK